MTAEGDDIAGTVAGGPGLGSRAPAFVQRIRALHLAWRGVVFVLGLAVVIAGIVLLPLPGPGWLIIFGGMAIWATEFSWAQRVMHWTKRKLAVGAKAAKRRFRKDRPTRSED
jgi:uncharacterized protein (TIGR02611 family)